MMSNRGKRNNMALRNRAEMVRELMEQRNAEDLTMEDMLIEEFQAMGEPDFDIPAEYGGGLTEGGARFEHEEILREEANARLEADFIKTGEWDESIRKARDIRQGISPLIQPDGRESTHMMTSGEIAIDGEPVYIAFPTLFSGYEDKDAEVSREEWIDLGTPEGVFPEEAYQLASKRDEIFVFPTEAMASAFAKGAWKPKEVQDILIDEFNKLENVYEMGK
jgi:hypothetical protein